MSNVISPDDYLIEAKKWKDAGAQIIGGCCGTTVEHIKILNKLKMLLLRMSLFGQ